MTKEWRAALELERVNCWYQAVVARKHGVLEARIAELEREVAVLRSELNARSPRVVSRVHRDGRVKAIQFSDEMVVIPPGADGTFEDAQRDRKRQAAGDGAASRIEELDAELFETIIGVMQ